MQEVLAVYDRDGNVLFHNSSWRGFCEQQELKATLNLEEMASVLGLAADLSRLSSDPEACLERELFLRATSWRFRMMRLPWPSAAEPTLLLGEDISARR